MILTEKTEKIIKLNYEKNINTITMFAALIGIGQICNFQKILNLWKFLVWIIY